MSNLQKTSDNGCLLENDQIEKQQESLLIDDVLRKDYSNQEVMLAVVSKLQRLRSYYHLKFVDLFCNEAVKDIDISKEV